MTLNGESVTRNDRPCHSDITIRHEIGLPVACHDVAVAQYGAILIPEGLVDCTFSGKDADMTWHAPENGRRHDLENALV